MKIASLENVSFYRAGGPVSSTCEGCTIKVVHGPQRGHRYLFNGRVEVFRDNKSQLRIHIWKNTGEIVGAVYYGDVSCNDGKKYVDLERGVRIKTVHHLQEEQYFVYVSYEENYVVLRMDVCPGDEDILNKLLC